MFESILNILVAGLHALMSPWVQAGGLGLFLFGYTWVTKVDNVDYVAAAHVNLLQTEKADRDGQIPCTGVVQWKKGADVASAAALPLGSDGNYFDVTGAVTITSIVQTAVGGAAVQAGTVVKLHFNGAPMITHSANLYLPDAEDHQVLANEELEFTCFGANQWRCTAIGTSYREGIWTPVLNFGGAHVGMTGTFVGTYTKTGRKVHYFGEITLTALGSSTGGTTITGVPFSTTESGVGLVLPLVALAGLTAGGAIYVYSYAATFYLAQLSTTIYVDLTHANFTNTSTFRFNIDNQI